MLPSNVEQRLAEYYSAKNILKHNSIELETLAQDIMVTRLLSDSALTVKVPEECEEFIKSLIQ